MSDNTWRIEPDLPIAMPYCQLISSNNQVYAFAYGSKGFFFKPENGTWENLPDSSVVGSNVSRIIVDNKLYPFGDPNTVVPIYNLITNQTVSGQNIPNNIRLPQLVGLERKIYAVGGHTSSGATSNRLFEYDIDSDSWTEKAPMLEARNMAAVVLVDKKIYAFGGEKSQTPFHKKTAEVYDVETNTWDYIQEMPNALTQMAAAVYGHEVYLCGGTGVETSDKTIIYDVLQDTYFEGVPLPQRACFRGAAILNNCLYLAGGSSEPSGMISLVLDDTPGPGPTPEPSSCQCNCIPTVTFSVPMTSCNETVIQDIFDRLKKRCTCKCDCNCAIN